ncbi:MAG: methylated-DNA--[protein]-cysteine S-methyltransferase [Alphaproteobacteria bacterium]|nr:methylated-DNA--[protein]-cysteine S-methyltransferase [Alphaproteobacteria bacterium]
MTTFFRDRLETPIGAIAIVTDGTALRALEFEEHADRLDGWLSRRGDQPRFVPGHDPLGVTARLAAYFAGRLDAIAELPCHAGGTAFQEQVWAALRRIPAGATMSYGALAAALGKPAAMRAVGAANGRNPISIVVPCHRVIGADGSLTGYGGGIARKRWLLAHEGAAIPGASRAGA